MTFHEIDNSKDPHDVLAVLFPKLGKGTKGIRELDVLIIEESLNPLTHVSD
jgi:hypothetical protein